MLLFVVALAAMPLRTGLADELPSPAAPGTACVRSMLDVDGQPADGFSAVTRRKELVRVATDTPPVPCRPGDMVVAWADSQLGAAYAAIAPYRFGDVAWPGGTLCARDRDRCWTYPAGAIVYDCSGFVVAAWRHVGIDVLARYGIATSTDFASPLLPDADWSALQPGDIAVYRPTRNIGHVVLIHDVDPSGVVHTIESTGAHGVEHGTLDWSRVTAIKRLDSTTGS